MANRRMDPRIDEASAMCLAIVEFMRATHPSPLLDEMRRIVQQTEAKRSLTGLRTLLADLREWASGMPRADIERLNERLKQQFGRGLDELVDLERVVKKVLRAGTIRHEEEYRFVEMYLEKAAEDGAPSTTLAQLKELLRAYQSPK